MVDGEVATCPEQNRSDESGVSQRSCWVFTVLEEGHGEHTNDGGCVSNKPEKDWEKHIITSCANCEIVCDNHCSNDRANKGLEDIRTHSSDVADVVTDVVCNDARVAWIVFRNTCFDLTNEVCTDVSSLGVNTATDTSEERNG